MPASKIANLFFATRTVLIGAVASILLAYVYRTFLDNKSISAVLCSHQITVISPIDGRIVDAGKLTLSSRITPNAPLLRIVSENFDEKELNDAQQRLALARITYEKTSTLLDTARQQLAQEKHNYASSQSHALNVVKVRSERDERYLDKAISKLDLARSDYQKKSDLVTSGFVSTFALQEANANLKSADDEVQALKANVRSTRATYDLIERNLEVEDQEVPQLSAVRGRMIALRKQVADYSNDKESAKRQVQTLESQLQARTKNAGSLREASIVSPASGMISGAFVSTGATVTKGERLLAYLDCSEFYVTANVSRRIYERLSMEGASQEATLKIEDKSYRGRILSITPAVVGDYGLYPLMPSVPPSQMYSPTDGAYVALKVEGDTGELSRHCPIGVSVDAYF